MKKIIIALAAVLAMATSVNAQQIYNTNSWSSLDSPHSISVGYGLSAIGIAFNAVSNLFSFADELFDEEISINGGGTGFINLNYDYQLNRTFTIGGNFGFNRMSLDLKDNTGSITAASLNMFTIMVESRIYWFNKPSVGMYSKPALGVMIANGNVMESNDAQTICLPTGHLSLVGVEFGGDTVRGFSELGAGFQGFLQLGLRFRI